MVKLGMLKTSPVHEDEASYCKSRHTGDSSNHQGWGTLWGFLNGVCISLGVLYGDLDFWKQRQKARSGNHDGSSVDDVRSINEGYPLKPVVVS